MTHGTPFQTAEATVFGLLRHEDTRARGKAPWWWLAALSLLAWVGNTGFLATYRRTQVTTLLEVIAPGPVLFGCATALVVMIAAVAWWRRARALAGAAAVVAAFLAGHLLYAEVYRITGSSFHVPFRAPGSAIGFAAARLSWAASVGLACLAAWWLTLRREPGAPSLALGHGDWSVRGRDFTARDVPRSWARRLGTGYLLVMAGIFLVMQANVAFAPLRSGALAGWLPAILLAAGVNAVAEEFVFRGLVQPAFIRFGGVGAGLWMQGLLFGLLHWNNSVGLLAALPVSLLIGLGSVVWGKAALETRGLTWVIVAHALVDIGVMSAFFIPA